MDAVSHRESDLPHQVEPLTKVGGWSLHTLPIEFSRISDNKRLTLVIGETNGTLLVTRSIRSACARLDEAIENLRLLISGPQMPASGAKRASFRLMVGKPPSPTSRR